ncbi:MAG: 16S rRNA (guanine(966)-N(2))-methyltransferase RsmD [Proteobacteria bacterium]|nr:16S rRNA (guanine(966)-N(2))-methyltransferase RsmD [Pseudomonadota bacterium]
MLRIISGGLKGKKLKTLPGKNTRPTAERTREMIFNTLRSRFHMKDFRVIDLFAGTGALGIEALSNGALDVKLIEHDKKCFRTLQENIQICNIEKHCTLFHVNSLDWLKGQSWLNELSLFLIDPPYNTELLQQVINILFIQKERLSGSLLVIERDKHHNIDLPSQFNRFKSKKLSRTILDFLEIL